MRNQLAVIAAFAAVAAFGSVAHAEPGAPAPEIHPLDLRALYVQRGGALVFSPALEALRGARVRVRGYMIQMEDGPRGAFYLATRPIEQDESGAGTGDIPVHSVRVEVPEASSEIPWRPALVEVVGTLEIGRAEDEDGRVSSVRVILADPAAR
jgi:hypothetical protein